MSLHPGHLGLSELLVEPDQLTGGVSGGGQQPQVEVVAEVAVDGDDGEAGSDLNSKKVRMFLSKSPADFIGEVAGFGHHLLG